MEFRNLVDWHNGWISGFELSLGERLKDTDKKAKFMEELIKTTNFTAPVIVSPSMSGSFALPYLLNDAVNADKKSHGYIPVAPVIPEGYKDKIQDLKV